MQFQIPIVLLAIVASVSGAAIDTRSRIPNTGGRTVTFSTVSQSVGTNGNLCNHLTAVATVNDGATQLACIKTITATGFTFVVTSEKTKIANTCSFTGFTGTCVGVTATIA